MSTAMKSFKCITDRKIRVAVIGCGRISSNHFASIEAFANDLELIAVCDIDPVVLNEVSKRHRVPGYDSLEKLLCTENPDLVILSTPSGLHPQQAILAAAHKVNVVSEKPMATKLEDGVAMIRACEEAGSALFVVKQNRKNATLQLLKQAVDQGRFGKIYNVAVNVFWQRPQEYYDQGGGWRGTWEFDGGAFMNQASHYVDLLTWIIGPVESVMAYTATQARKIEAEDSGVVALKWRNGALGTINVSMLTYPKNLEGSITIIGEKGTADIGGVAVNEIKTWEFSDTRPSDSDVREASYATTSVYGFGHPLYYRNIVSVFRGTEPPETDGRAGLKSLELLTAIYLSARDGRKVALPLNY